MDVLLMPRMMQLVLWMHVAVDDLRERGFVLGVGPLGTPKGRAAFDQLEADGFIPTDEELEFGLERMGFPKEDFPTTIVLLRRAREQRRV